MLRKTQALPGQSRLRPEGTGKGRGVGVWILSWDTLEWILAWILGHGDDMYVLRWCCLFQLVSV